MSSRDEERPSFTPEISEYARHYPAADVPLSERAVEDAAERREWRKQAKREQQERSSPRFRPDTGRASRSGVHQRDSSGSSSGGAPLPPAPALDSSDEEEGDSFAPEISTYARSLIRDEPVYDRLYNLSKERSAAAAALNASSERLTVDPVTGAPLFHPVTNPVFTVRDERVEDSLYKDAANRQLRKELLLESIKTAEEHQRKAPKITNQSKGLSRKRIEASIVDAFDKVDVNGFGTISNEQLGQALELLDLFKKVTPGEHRPQSEQSLQEKLWAELDPHQTGAVDFATFRKEMLQILDMPTQNAASPNKSLATKFRQLAVNRLSYMGTGSVRKSVYQPPQMGSPSRVHIPADQRRSPAALFTEIKTERELKEQKLKEKREALEQKELAECTFAPKINELPPQMSARRNPGFSFYNGPKSQDEREEERRLFEERNKPREEPLDPQCTFKPNISKNRRAPKPRNTPTGYDQAISRMRMAQQNKHENSQTRFLSSLRIKDEEASASQLVQSGRKRGSLTGGRSTEVKPFDFELEKRKRTKPLLYIDVNLGHGKTGRIGVHEHDDPSVLASNFASSYHLDEFLCKRLEELIVSHMEAQAIPASSGSSSRRESVEMYGERDLYDEFGDGGVEQTNGYDQYGGYDEQYEYDYQPEDVDYYEPQQQQQQQQEQQKEGSPGRLTAGDLDGTSA